MGRFTQNMFQWNKNDIKSSQTTNGDYFIAVFLLLLLLILGCLFLLLLLIIILEAFDQFLVLQALPLLEWNRSNNRQCNLGTSKKQEQSGKQEKKTISQQISNRGGYSISNMNQQLPIYQQMCTLKCNY